MTPPSATGGALVAGLARPQLLDIYRALQMTRQLEHVLANLYRQNKVIGGLYRSLGQEAGAVGTAYALRRREDGSGDILAPAIRDLGALLLMGAPPVAVLRQYMAKGDSPTGGREQNVHFTDYERGYVGLISHLGVMVEVMAGVALSFKVRGEDRVALVYAGDGMTSTGAFHEGLNLAAVQRLPLVCVVESNGYAYSTPTSRQAAVESFVDRAPGYGIAGERCDGNDVLAVYEAARRAVDRARSGGGVTLLELMTYRRLGHAEHDAQGYVPDGEIGAWERRDPIALYERRLRAEGWAEDAELEAVRGEVAAVIDEARDQAEASGMPEPEGALGGVYGDLATPAPWTRAATPHPAEA
ncbi:MAG TPA: thiamine pyrophosphate-dependent dehydrogenase E1 component subunit alpha [Longimicrobiales bacterium]|nr:thiamine pyrophosphate-dependent dehydrogenase E1 component subunit alpha [Longimicrobiales bacterium]